MTDEQISKMALDAGFGFATSLYQRKEIQRFAKLVRNTALEEAAQLCDRIWQEDGSAMRCRDEIRSMK